MIASQTEFSLQVSICAWCKPGDRDSSLGAISHGICLRHLRNLKLETQGLLPARAKSRSRRTGRPDPREEMLFPI
jgi:hypothetical protein